MDTRSATAMRRDALKATVLPAHVHVGDGEGLDASGNDAKPYQQRKRRRWRRQRQRSGRQSELLPEAGLWGGQPEYPHLQPEQPYSQRNRPEALPVCAAGGMAWETAPVAGAATGGGDFPAMAAGGGGGRGAGTRGRSGGIASNTGGESGDPPQQSLPRGGGGARGGWGAGTWDWRTVWVVAPATSSTGGPVAPAVLTGEGVTAPTSAATLASAAQEVEDECEEDSRWLENEDKRGKISNGSGDGSIVALSAGAEHSGAHPTVTD
ncbi:unnamed protein product [Ectocarpus sp. CCAP 1310/34]|nr:unnamed protein product [Ectocarpus sp. CCAP 1310/34]